MEESQTPVVARIFSPVTILSVILLAAYCSFHGWLGALTLNHILFSGAILVFYHLHRTTRRFLLLASPILIKEALYDSLRYIPFDWLKPIHIGDLYNLEKVIFGITCGGALKPVNECLLLATSPIFDALFGFVYHLLNPIVLLLLILLWRLEGDHVASRYTTAFLLMNLMAFATYLLYPSAAPWYVAQHGFVQPLHPIPGDPAGLLSLDKILGVDVSSRIYGLNPVVFGAVPSMHAGFTMLGALYAFRFGRKFGLAVSAYAVSMWFAALYLQHHYLIDIVWGVLYALICFAVIEGPLREGVARALELVLSLFEERGPVPLLGKAPSRIAHVPAGQILSEKAATDEMP